MSLKLLRGAADISHDSPITWSSWSATQQINVPDVVQSRVLVFLLLLLGIVWRLQQGQFLWSSDVWEEEKMWSISKGTCTTYHIPYITSVPVITRAEGLLTEQRHLLSIWQISATALKTTQEKLTVILTVFMLGSCSSRDLCCGV